MFWLIMISEILMTKPVNHGTIIAIVHTII